MAGIINAAKQLCLAIKKQNPKRVHIVGEYVKPKHYYEFGHYSYKSFCPTCGERVYDEKYCRECGQALKY